MSRAIAFGAVCLLLAGCAQQMAKQPAYRPLEPSSFFADGQSSRPLVAGTVARGQLDEDPHLYLGLRPGVDPASVRPSAAAAAAPTDLSAYVDTFPFPVTQEVLHRGRERYQIFCAICHGKLGNGGGKIPQRGFTRPPSYHTDLARGLKNVHLRDAPVGYYFDVVTNGYGAMASYAGQVPVRDRWAIIAHIRALQLSQNVPVGELTEQERQELEKGDQGP
jgi:mono/diheme cytochrome c family protein